MANTGRESVITLKELILPNPPENPTGNTKPNVVGEPDYIAPYINLSHCPVISDTTCPYFLATGSVGTVEYEFTLLDSVLANPSVATVRVQLMDSTNTTVQQVQNYSLPMTPDPNYKGAIFGSVAAGIHVMNVLYLNSGGTTVATCTNVATITTT